MTEQEFFDKTIRHFIKQGKPALDRSGVCQFQTSTGLQCAIGCHIPDSVYQPEMEGRGSYKLINDFPEVMQYLTDNQGLLRDLQYCHDILSNWRDPKRMVSCLRDIAEVHYLNTKVLDSLDFSNIRPGD